MNKTEVMAISIEMARSGRGLNPADAIDYIAELIAREDPASELYDWRVEKLLATAACIWRLRREQIT
ncbi:hypothetical protein SAMN05443580_13216 [Variovorax sp. OV084]|jgi:hypothetical protein|uniref:hypothetical protein n=2 Tax=Variovorax TaxID=34072 RepID=UPI0008C8B930|nr:hypothetical protein SAMN05443580_13216 [Variovorax sp. OV084]